MIMQLTSVSSVHELYDVLQTWHQYVEDHKKRFVKHNRLNTSVNDVVRNDSAYMFDAIWTAALALNRTAIRLKEENLTLKDFDYNDKHNISGMIYEEALNTKFFGLTVRHDCIVE